MTSSVNTSGSSGIVVVHLFPLGSAKITSKEKTALIIVWLLWHGMRLILGNYDLKFISKCTQLWPV